MDFQHFNPRSPWGERLISTIMMFAGRKISIHAPRGGSDRAVVTSGAEPTNFNPRSPWGERRHSLGADPANTDFNPRSPWGERQLRRTGNVSTGRFQSTLPVGGATGEFGDDRGFYNDFNPRSPWGERPDHQPPDRRHHDFNPRSPWGERHICQSRIGKGRRISIHAPRGGSDLRFF